MPVKPIFGSYPYLTIAKKYDLDYGDVLIVGDFMTHGKQNIVMEISQARWDRIEKELDSRPEDPLKYHFGLFLSDMNISRENFKRIQTEGWDQS